MSGAVGGERGPGKHRLVVFTRLPEEGSSKTRLASALTGAGAAQLQREMTARILADARAFSEGFGTDLEVRFTGGDRRAMREEFGHGFVYQRQGAGDLGERMLRAFAESAASGFQRTVTIGSDCIDIDAALLQRAFEALGETDVVFGPATDGGYYLVGLREPAPSVFSQVAWGTGEVLARSLEKAEAAGLSVSLLGELRDIDTPEDLYLLRHCGGPGRGRISVVIPSLDDESTITAAVSSALLEGAEVIVADGASVDGSVAVARSLGAMVIEAGRGRARQMNAGAEASSNDILLFLHADSRLPVGFAGEVVRIMSDPRVAGGAFEFMPDRRVPGLDGIRRLINFRSRFFSMPYGDQGLFLRRGTFMAMGGFPEWPIMEDYALVKGLKRRGRIQVSPLPVVTSARRWEKLGVARVTLVNQLVILGYHLGLGPERLLCWYRGAE